MDNKNTDPTRINNPSYNMRGDVGPRNTDGRATPPRNDVPPVRRQNFQNPDGDVPSNAERVKPVERQMPPQGAANPQFRRPMPQNNPPMRPAQQTGDVRPAPRPNLPKSPIPADAETDAAQTKQVPFVSPNASEDTSTLSNLDVSTRVNETVAKDATQNLGDPVKPDSSKTVQTKKSKKSLKRFKDNERSESGNTVISLVKCIAYITVVFAVSVVISVAVIFAANDIYGFVKSEDETEITIPEGADIDEVAEILYNNKIIKYKWLFKFKEGDFAGVFEPGTYVLIPETSYDDIINTIRKKAPAGISWITIPEGYTTDEIIDLLVSAGIGERDRYVDVINNYEFDYWFMDEIDEDWVASERFYRLDGYLFPDTYQLYNASSEVAVIDKILARFNQVYIKAYKQRAEELGYTSDEILVIASLVEKEAGGAADYGNVSSVFHNRLKNPANYPYLESDATTADVVHHETGVRVKLKGSDIDNIGSMYNSYAVAGLVPGAIANPGNSAILAALNPSETQYYFFFSAPDKTIFSKTLQEHNAVVSQYSQ